MYGETPTLKRVGLKTERFCETCKHQMKITDKCEWHQDREPCYYCHLIRHHMDKNFDDKPKKKSSRKESPVQQT